MKHFIHIIAFILLLPCIAQAQDVASTRLQRFQQLFAEKPYWICVKSYRRCTINEGEIVSATDYVSAKNGNDVGDKFHFEGSVYTKYDAETDYKFARPEFNTTLYTQTKAKVWNVHHLSLLNDGSIVMRKNNSEVVSQNEYPYAIVLAPITEEHFEDVKEEKHNAISPTLEEYFHDAQPLPRNIKKILRREECWVETYEHCELKDGVVRVVGFMVGGGINTIRKFSRGFKGKYYSIRGHSIGSKKIDEGKFCLHKDDFLYYLDGDIIYIPRETLTTDGRMGYYRLTPSEHSFDKTKELICEAGKNMKFGRGWGMKMDKYYPLPHKEQ